jgi:hypothetical protein
VKSGLSSSKNTFASVRELLNDEEAGTLREQAQEGTKTFERLLIKGYIDGFFLSIVSLICLIALYVALQH